MKCDRSFKRDQSRRAALDRHFRLMNSLMGQGHDKENASRIAYRYMMHYTLTEAETAEAIIAESNIRAANDNYMGERIVARAALKGAK